MDKFIKSSWCWYIIYCTYTCQNPGIVSPFPVKIFFLTTQDFEPNEDKFMQHSLVAVIRSITQAASIYNKVEHRQPH